MTLISKCLVVLVTIASLAFAGFVSVMVVAGPNWKAEMQQLEGYQFTESEGEVTTWSAQSLSGEQVPGGATPVVPEVIVNAREHLKQQQQDRLRQLDETLPRMKTELETARQFVKDDLAALERREQELKQRVQELRAEIKTVSTQAETKREEAYETHQLVARRRSEVARLKNELAAVQADRLRAESEVQELNDLLVRVRGGNQRLARRRKQLADSLGGGPSDAGASESADGASAGSDGNSQ